MKKSLPNGNNYGTEDETQCPSSYYTDQLTHSSLLSSQSELSHPIWLTRDHEEGSRSSASASGHNTLSPAEGSEGESLLLHTHNQSWDGPDSLDDCWRYSIRIRTFFRLHLCQLMFEMIQMSRLTSRDCSPFLLDYPDPLLTQASTLPLLFDRFRRIIVNLEST